MESPKSDETSPTYNRHSELRATEEDTSVQQSADADQASGVGVTQPMTINTEQRPVELASAQPSEGQSIGDTQPSVAQDEGMNVPPDIPSVPHKAPGGGRKWILWALIAVAVLALIAGGSAFAGYSSAIDQRLHNQSTQVAGEAAKQFALAQQDITNGNYGLARQRLEYIIKIDPNFPNASDQLTFVLTQQRITATPTIAPTPTLTPTPDYRGRDDLFSQAQSSLVARNWTGTIDTLLLLRKNFPDYMAVKVDDMLFVALRNRGIDKIANQHDLEGGNYDLTLAERFGPLDAEANNWRDWADMYIRGASFWDVDWAQAVYYFSQLANAAPNLSDSSGWTASNRYLDALLGYGDWFAASEQWCDAQSQYDTYMTLVANPTVEPTAVYAADKCTQASNPPPPPVVTPLTETPTPTSTVQPQTTPYP